MGTWTERPPTRSRPARVARTRGQITVALTPNASLTEAELWSYLDGRMLEFMQPTYVEFVDEIPTTKTNKMEKYKLREQVIKREEL
jgi:acyl-coenzyme A synthetase/AMP-(fatty) acid ligase